MAWSAAEELVLVMAAKGLARLERALQDKYTPHLWKPKSATEHLGTPVENGIVLVGCVDKVVDGKEKPLPQR